MFEKIYQTIFIIGIIIAFREFWCWLFKINKIMQKVDALQAQVSYLQSEITLLKSRSDK